MSEETIAIVHSSEIDQLFERLGMKDAFEAGEIRCSVTGAVITEENFRAVFKSEGELRFVSKDGLPKLVIPLVAPQGDEEEQ